MPQTPFRSPSVLLFCEVWGLTQIIGMDGRCFYPLSRLANPWWYSGTEMELLG